MHLETYLHCKIGKHTVGLHYKAGTIEVTSDVRSVPLGAKRRKGRPKKIPNCLSKSPVAVNLPNEHTGDETEDDFQHVEVMEETNEPEEPVVDVGVQTRKIKQPGLNN